MSFIVKGVDLPKNYIAVEIKIFIPVRIGLRECHREVSALFGPEALDNIIQIPKDHGRIVDLKNIRYCSLSSDGKSRELNFLLDTQVDRLPTILEAEEDKMRDCESCVYARPFGGANDNRCSAWSCEFIDRKEAIELWNKFTWRPISEKPDSGQMGKDYLVYTEFGIGIATYFPNDKWSGYDVMGDGFGGDIILAWMPLPEPPKGE